MDIQRTRTRPPEQSKAIDGFFVNTNHTRRGHTAAPRAAVRTPHTGTTNAGQRRINDFGRADGFHAAPRRSAGNMFSPAPTTSPKTQAAAMPSTEPTPKRASIGRRSRSKSRTQPVSKFRRSLKWAVRGTAVGLVVLLAVGGLLFGKGYFKLKKVFDGTGSAAALQAEVDPSLLKGEGDGRINVLMMGIGGSDHSGGDLTDTIMVASIDPVNNQAILLSIPRDLWTKMPNNFISNYQKINAAYESGKYKYLGKQDSTNSNKKAIEAGFQGADSVVERVTGVPIHYNVLVDFKAFRQAIDTVGGVTINAPEQLYDPSMAWENNRSPVLAKLGINNFDGKQALNYVRSRETSSDFARSERQRAVLMALKDKVLNKGTLTNPVKLSQLMSAFGDNVQTDISLNDMTRMATLAKKIPNNQIQSVGLADPPNNFLTTGTINGLSVVQPRAGLEDYSKIQAFVRSKLKDGYITKENANVTVLNGTVVPGLATEKGDELKSYGYNVGTVDNAPTPDYDKTTIIDFTNGAKKYTLGYLKTRYHVQTVSKQLPAGIVRGNADIVIILGQDASTITQN
ncbi:MAG TPA: LCP family protein [Candidatus Saccharimonadales bacterium]|jgi:LCP family protein required for cell wall assembly